MITNAEREYARRRAYQELRMTFAADCVEAELVHNKLTRLCLDRCIGCAPGRTAECEGCALEPLCEQSPRMAERADNARRSAGDFADRPEEDPA